MHVIGFLNSKGGVGKSTLCSAIAVHAATEGHRVAIVDLDPQESIADWWRRRGEPDNPTIINGSVRASEVIADLKADGLDWVFLDGPPGALLVTDDAIKSSDFVVIPLRASSLDLIASQDAVKLCQDAAKPFTLVFNSCKGGAKDKLVDDARGVLKSSKVPVAATAVTQRVAFVTAMTKGKTGAEKDTAASEEIEALWREIKAAAVKAAKAKRGGA